MKRTGQARSQFQIHNSDGRHVPPVDEVIDGKCPTHTGTQLLDEDNEDNEPVVTSESGNWTNIPISRLFDFTTNSWSSRYARFAALTFEEELEL